MATTLAIYGCRFAYADGCSYGVEPVTQEGMNEEKWTLAYLNCEFAEVLRRRGRKCDGTHDHVHSRGRDTELTGLYPVGIRSDTHE